MCMGIPMKVLSSEGHYAVCEGQNGTEGVSLALIDTVKAGDHVLVFLGSAVRVIDEAEAMAIRDALSAVGKAAKGEAFDHLIEDLINREPELPEHLR